MENKKPRGETGSRFGESVNSRRPTGSYRTPPAGSYRSRPGYQAGQHRPTGFGSVGNTASKAGNKPQSAADAKEQKRLEKRLQKEEKRLDRQSAKVQGEKRSKRPKARRGLKAVLIAACGALVLLLLVVFFFGNGSDNYHQLPTITREEETPAPTTMPGVKP